MRSSLILLALVALIAHLAACGGTGGLQSALVRVVHSAPTTPPVDLYIDGNPFLVGLSYTEVSSYLLLPARTTFTFDVRVSGAPNVTVLNLTTALNPGTPYTVTALGAPAQLLVSADSLNAPPVNYALIRFIHASPNAPAVAVFLGQTKIFSKVSYPSATTYVPYVPSGSFLGNGIYLQPGGGATQVPLGYLDAKPGVAYTIVATGYVGGSGTQALQAIISEDV